ncbi:MAG: FecR domain-containing protein [Spirochaetes bacterium]|nr:FecR domain-containing protein [Spirochaetota bacterium]
MKSLKTDRLIPLVTICMIALFSFMLYADFTGQFTRSRAEAIGVLTYEKRTAQRRYAEEVVWEGIDRNETVYNCDYLRTMEDSGAIVRLDDGTDIEIDENTLVLVCRTKQGVDIDLDQGSIAARRKPAGGAMKIATRFAEVDVKSAVVDVGISKGGMNLAVSSGSAEVTAGGKKETVNSGYDVSVTGDTITREALFARQLEPGINRYFVTTGGEYRVAFSWETDTAREVTVQVAKDAAFTALAGTVAVDTTRAGMDLPAGAYYWRLADAAGKTGPVRVFTIVNDGPVVPLAPRQAEEIPAGMKNPLVQFAWEPSGAATSYMIEISSDPGFKTIIRTLKSDTASIATDELAPGSYYWRIRTQYAFSPDVSLYSRTGRFSIVRATALVPPEPLVPANGGTIPDISIASGKSLFNWKSDSGYTAYEFTIAADDGFGRVVYRESTGNNFEKPKVALGKGAYFWRVRGMTGAGALSPPSRAMKINVVGAEPPVLVAPGPGESIGSAGSGNILFRWKGQDHGQRYRIEIASDREFKSVVRAETVVGLRLAAPVPGTGNYFWRVKLLDTGGTPLASEPRAFSIMEALEAPGGAFPADNDKVEITSKRGMLFTWDPVKGATHYQVSLKRIVSGSEKVIFSTRVKETRYRFSRTELLDAGRFAWEVSAIRQQGRGAEVRSEPEQNYFTIKPGRRLEAPELKSRVIYVE